MLTELLYTAGRILIKSYARLMLKYGYPLAGFTAQRRGVICRQPSEHN